MLVAHRIQLMPNNHHRVYFKKACGVSRFCYNWALDEWKRQYQAGGKPNAASLKKDFTRIQDQFPWLKEVTSYAKQRAFVDLGDAFKHFFRRVKAGEKPGYPRFKCKGKCRDSFYLANTCLVLEGRRVKIQKLGWVRLRQPLRFQGKLMGARVSREADKWFIAIQVEVPDPIPLHAAENQGREVGIDLGVKALATLSTGEQIAGPKAYAKARRRLKRLQRQLRPRKRAKGSRRYRQYKLKVGRLHRRIAGIRKDALHQLSARLTNRFAIIAMEDLNVRGMSASAAGDAETPGQRVRQKSGLNRSILDMGFYELRRQIEYKGERKGCQVVFIDRWAPSSKTCAHCGCLKPDLTLADRLFHCEQCGHELDRDLNAALNIRALGLATLSGATRGARGSDARGDDGSAHQGNLSGNQHRGTGNVVAEPRR